MEQTFSFQITAPDPVRLCPQVSRALEQRTELVSRQKYPKMWNLTDKLNSVEKCPQAVRENRRKRRAFLGFWNWALAVVLLVPGFLMQKGALLLLLIGAASYGSGVTYLWKYSRTLLGILNLVTGTVLCFGALGAPTELGALLPFGIVCAVIGVAALLPRKQAKKTPFDQTARKLLLEKSPLKDTENLRVAFSGEGMTMSRETAEPGTHTVPYHDVTFVLETEDLLLPVCGNTIMILQKKDLLAGTIPELRDFLSQQTQYVKI